MSDDVSGLIFYSIRAAFAYFQFPRIVKKLFQLWIFTNKLYIQYDMISIYTFFFLAITVCFKNIYMHIYIQIFTSNSFKLVFINLKNSS